MPNYEPAILSIFTTIPCPEGMTYREHIKTLVKAALSAEVRRSKRGSEYSISVVGGIEAITFEPKKLPAKDEKPETICLFVNRRQQQKEQESSEELPF